MAYLDENGLEHFWGKIKDHVDSAVAPKANDANVVHKTGDVVIEGVATFQNTSSGHGAGETVTDLIIRNPEVDRGTPVEAGRSYTRVILADAEGDIEETFAGRLGLLEVVSPKENDTIGEELRLGCYRYSDVSADYSKNALLKVGYDLDAIPFSTAPATSDDRTESTDIVTRGYMEASEWNWQKSKKAGAVTFKPAPESDLEPVVDFMFTETPPAEGEKGPENPSTITGVSSINLTRTNTNLLLKNPAESRNFASIAFTCNGDGSYTANGTANGGFSTRDTVGSFRWNLRNLPNGTYILKFKEGLPAVRIGATITRGGTTSYPGFASETNTIHLYEDTTYYMLYFYGAEGTSYSNATTHPYLVMEGTDTVFEVPQDDTYAISLGNTYYGGSLDVAAGVMTVTWVGKVLTDVDADQIALFGTVGVDSRMVYNITQHGLPIPKNGSSYSICSHSNHYLGSNTGVWGDYYVSYASNNIGYFVMQDKNNVIGTTEQAYSNWVASQYSNGTPVTFVYAVATPFTVQLTPTQIRSLPALNKYEPRINTVYTDQEAVQVGYQRFFDENRLAAIEARLDALEGN